jgi:hypothetical protein
MWDCGTDFVLFGQSHIFGYYIMFANAPDTVGIYLCRR